jgi:hypothetical protein
VTAEVGQAQLLHVGHLENDSHVLIPFCFGHKKSRPELDGNRAVIMVSYAASGGAGGGDSATLKDSACLQPSESVSDCRKS